MRNTARTSLSEETWRRQRGIWLTTKVWVPGCSHSSSSSSVDQPSSRSSRASGWACRVVSPAGGRIQRQAANHEQTRPKHS